MEIFFLNSGSSSEMFASTMYFDHSEYGSLRNSGQFVHLILVMRLCAVNPLDASSAGFCEV